MLDFQSKLSTIQLRLSVVTRVEDFKVRIIHLKFRAEMSAITECVNSSVARFARKFVCRFHLQIPSFLV